MLAANDAAKIPHAVARVGGHLRAGDVDRAFLVRGPDSPTPAIAEPERI